MGCDMSGGASAPISRMPDADIHQSLVVAWKPPWLYRDSAPTDGPFSPVDGLKRTATRKPSASAIAVPFRRRQLTWIHSLHPRKEHSRAVGACVYAKRFWPVLRWCAILCVDRPLSIPSR